MDARLPAPGVVFNGKYEIVRRIGGGGMGVVYEAHQKSLSRQVAIKILQPEIAAQPVEAARFEREARAGAALRSPHSVRIHDVDATPEGLVFMVMELLEGNDLAKELRANAEVPLCDLVDWMIQTCAALEEAHALRIVHRDLKPANIFLSYDGTSRARVAKVLDFGISKFLDQASYPGGLSTEPQTVLGTPSYMSPEQLRGRRVDHRTDIWAIGMVLYRALAGRAPFTAANSMEYLAAVIADPPIPFETVRPDLPIELANAIMKALEKSPEDRQASVSELAGELAPFGSGRTPLGAGATPSASGREQTPGGVTRRVLPQAEEALATTEVDLRPPIEPAPEPVAPSPRRIGRIGLIAAAAILVITTLVILGLSTRSKPPEPSTTVAMPSQASTPVATAPSAPASVPVVATASESAAPISSGGGAPPARPRPPRKPGAPSASAMPPTASPSASNWLPPVL